MRALCLALALMAALPARADVEDAVTEHILPGMAAFATAAADLDATAARDCQPATVRPAFQAAFQAWMAVADLRLGPSETGALSIAFWPDDRGFTPRALAALIKGQDPVALDPAAYAEVSIAARGVFALEMLLYDPAFAGYGSGDYTCALVQTLASDLNQQAKTLEAAWRADFAKTLLTAGDAGNATYLAKDEAVRALYTQILASLDINADLRLGRPLGSFDRPRPKQAEAWRSARSLQNLLASVQAAHPLAQALADHDLPLADAALDRLQRAALVVADPGFQDISDPQARLRVEILQQAVRDLRAAVEGEIGDALAIAAGFNALDGD